jgi:hypothetical protein
VNGLAGPVEDGYAPPRVTIGNPINGDSTASASVRVKGSATVTSFALTHARQGRQGDRDGEGRQTP